MKTRVEVSTGAAFLYPALYFYDSAGWFSALIPAAAIHEVGHALALRCCGSKILSLRLEVVGLCMECTALYNRCHEMLCSLAGPAAGFLWAFLLWDSDNLWLKTSGEISLGLSLFNMLPVLPLDGGRIVYAITCSDGLLTLLGYCIPLLMIGGSIWLKHYSLFLPAAVLLYVMIFRSVSTARRSRRDI